jgi:anthranilate synthase component I
VPGLPRFWGGAVGFFGYDVVRHVEHLPDAPPGDLDLPDALFMLTGAVVAIDNLFGRALAISAVETAGGGRGELRRRYDAAAAEIDELVARLRDGGGAGAAPAGPGRGRPAVPQHRRTRADFEEQVRRVQEYIRAGDVFQVVLSQRLTCRWSAAVRPVPRAARAEPVAVPLLPGAGRVPAGRLLAGGAGAGGGRRVTVRPIAGTRRRGASAAEDEALARTCWPIPRSAPST